MDPLKYSTYICLCAVERTPQDEYEKQVEMLRKSNTEALTIADFEYKVNGKHYASRSDIYNWLGYFGTTAQKFYGNEKAKALGL